MEFYAIMDRFVIRIPAVTKNKADSAEKQNNSEQNKPLQDNTVLSGKLIAYSVPRKIEFSCFVFFISDEGCSSSKDLPPRKKRKYVSSWSEKFDWILYNEESEKVFCKTCRQASEVKSPGEYMKTWEKRGFDAFCVNGFDNWFKALERFSVHERSQLHLNSLKLLTEVKKGTNVLASLNSKKAKEMQEAREVLLCYISSLQYLASQGLAIRGHTDEKSNYINLLKLRANDVPVLKLWLESKEGYKWLSKDIANEILDIMTSSVLTDILNEIRAESFYSIILDETTDCSCREQISFCIRTSTQTLESREYFLGFYETASTSAETLFTVVQDCLLRFNLNLHNCRGQCYDGASNVSGNITGLQRRIQNQEPRAVFVHCLAHNINLVAQDAMRATPQVRDFLNNTKDLITLVRKSPKRLGWFEKLQKDTVAHELDVPIVPRALKPFCPTRWCVRMKSLKSITENYEVLLLFLQELSDSSQNEIGASASGHLKKLVQFENWFFLKSLIQILEKVELLNATLQSTQLNFKQAENSINDVLSCLKNMRTDDVFENFWSEIVLEAKRLKLDDPQLPRIRRIPRRFDEGTDAHVFDNELCYYRKIFFEILDASITGIETRFTTEIKHHLAKLEAFAVCTEDDDYIIQFYGDDFNTDRLILHRNMFHDLMKEKNVKTDNLTDILAVAKSSECSHLVSMLPEFYKFLKMVNTIPVTSCTSERSFSCLRRLKTYLRTTMLQKRLNNIAILHSYAETLSHLNLEAIADEFIKRTGVRRNTFNLQNS